MKLESKILIKFASVICFGILLIVLSKFILQGFGSINHLPIRLFYITYTASGNQH